MRSTVSVRPGIYTGLPTAEQNLLKLYGYEVWPCSSVQIH